MAANYLQTLNWHSDPELMKHIISFYTKVGNDPARGAGSPGEEGPPGRSVQTRAHGRPSHDGQRGERPRARVLARLLSQMPSHLPLGLNLQRS